MNNLLLKTNTAVNYFKNHLIELGDYYEAITCNDFLLAHSQADKIQKSINLLMQKEGQTFDDAVHNDFFVLEETTSFLQAYAMIWHEINVGSFAKSWNYLQDTIDSLRLINKFSLLKSERIFCFFERQLQTLEALYPYSVFSSIEAIIGRLECSICKNDINSSECDHIKGELYRGKLAYGICKEIKELLSISLVQNPADKRCVMTEINGQPIQFPCLEFLKSESKTKRLNPFKILYVRKTIRKRTDGTNNCPEQEIQHREIVLAEKVAITKGDFTALCLKKAWPLF